MKDVIQYLLKQNVSPFVWFFFLKFAVCIDFDFQVYFSLVLIFSKFKINDTTFCLHICM